MTSKSSFTKSFVADHHRLFYGAVLSALIGLSAAIGCGGSSSGDDTGGSSASAGASPGAGTRNSSAGASSSSGGTDTGTAGSADMG
ncbi:MAG TPA: hypothetical protein VNG33_23375, partial [Polyangiaceae bacterium]|nr:hypothetical protein [Polyangiaceae bacterium]